MKLFEFIITTAMGRIVLLISIFAGMGLWKLME
jgi:hypothetical protein